MFQPPPPPPSSSRTHNRKLVIIGVVGIFLVVLLAVGAIASLSNNQPQNNNLNPSVTATPTATSQPTATPTITNQPTASPTPTPQPTIAVFSSPSPSPSPSPTPSNNIAISWTYQTASSVVDKYTVAFPNSGNTFVLVNMTITNNGYSDGFSTNPFYFSLIVNSVQYSYDSETYALGKWDTVNVLNSGTYSGTMVFQVPTTASSFTMNYQPFSSTNYNIIWTKT